MTQRSSTPALRVSCIAASLLLGVVLSPALAGPSPPPPVVSGRVSSRIEADPAGREALWIFFTDKGFTTGAAERRAVEQLPAPSRSLRAARRHAPDARDLPVAVRYVQSVVAAGATVRHPSRWLNAVSVEMDLARVPEVAKLPFVRRIDIVRRSKRVPDPPAGAEPDSSGAFGAVRPESSPGPVAPTGALGAATAYPAEELLHYGPSFNQDNQVGIVALHRLGYTGAGVTLAMFDTGFNTSHPAFAGRHVIAAHDFVFNDSNVNNEPVDDPSAWFHGTATWSNSAGLKAGALVGGAYEASIILAKTEDVRSETPIEEDNYVAALEWADSLGADIVSASLAYFDFDGTTNDYTYADMNGNTAVTTVAVDIAVSRGMAVVNAMGNSGPSPGSLNAPADADSVIAVGAVDSLSNVAGFSSRGPTYDGRTKPEVVARGVRNYIAYANTGGFSSGSGTSFSTPVTSGAATLLLEAHPEWNGYQLRQALMSTASHAGAPDNNTGWGIVNALGALDLSTPASPHVSLPFALIDPARGNTLTTAVPALRWERSRPAHPGDLVSYRVILSTSSTLAPADTFGAGPDTTWSPTFFLTPGTTYYWTVQAVNTAGWKRMAYMPSRFTVSSTVDAGPWTPAAPGFRLIAARPNPLSAATRISFALPELAGGSSSRSYSIGVFDAQGRLVRRLAEGSWGPEAHLAEITWDGRKDSGARAAAGIYFVNLDAMGLRSTLKIVVSR